jgi:hypothetical protein
MDPMEPEVQFFFYLGAVICFVLAALGEGWRHGARTRAGLKPALTLLPFGLALAYFPTLWNVGVEAF